MKTINRNNYEKYFIDFIEGNLDKSLHDELQAFLILNPDLQQELDGLDEIKLSSNKAVFIEKNLLKKQSELIINESNLDDICIAYYENDLHTGEKTDLINYISKNPGKKHDFKLFEKIYLKPDYSIIFDKKSQLNKFRIKTKLYYKIAATAAVTLGLIISFLLFNLKPLKEKTAVVKNQVKNINNTEVEKVKIEPKLKSIENNIITNTKIADNIEINTNRIIKNKETIYPILKLKLEEIPISFESTIVLKTNYTLNAKNEYYPTIREFAMDKLKTNLLKLNSPSEKPSELSIWDFIQAGIKSIENNSNINIDIERDQEKGKLKALAFNSKNFELTRSFN